MGNIILMYHPFFFPLHQVSANIALEAFLIHPSNFLGLSCTVLQQSTSSFVSPITDREVSSKSDSGMDSLLNFKCHTVNTSGSPASLLSKVRDRLVYSLFFCRALLIKPSKVGVGFVKTKLYALQVFAILLARLQSEIYIEEQIIL